MIINLRAFSSNIIPEIKFPKAASKVIEILEEEGIR